MTTNVDRPVITPEIMERFKAYHRVNTSFGSLHIVLEDGNLENSSVEFCIQWAKDNDDPEAVALGEILLSMTRTQRGRIRERCWNTFEWRPLLRR